ncbi:DUF4347 domain-containing protein [Kiritimatiellaeota bacterium B1221]|nr:DUF4347 domain-containing protein [Kiritimatiellaeota bacterium B1221]
MKTFLSLFIFVVLVCTAGRTDTFFLQSSHVKEVLFLDSGVAEAEMLRNGVRSGVEVIMLDRGRNGLEQIAETLRGRRNLLAVHVVSHAKPGQLLLGNDVVTLQAIESASETLNTLGDALSLEADLLLYGCSLAEGVEGKAFIDALSTMTGADVAASVNLTGSEGLGADWVLEAQSGRIETASVFTSATEKSYVAGTLQFSTGQFLTGNANTNNFSAQAIGPGETIYGAWNYSGGNGTMKFATWNGSGWTEVPGSAITGATVAGQLSGLDYLSQLGPDSFKVDSNGDLHVALAVSASAGGVTSHRGLAYGFFDVSTQTWTFRRIYILSDPSGWHNLVNGGAVMLLDASENPHIVFGWSDANSPRWHYLEHAFYNGASWNVTGNLNAKDADTLDSLSGGPEINGLDGEIDSAGNIHITYAREDGNSVDGDIWYIKRTGSTWGTPVEIINVDDIIRPSMALDASGNVHVAWSIEDTTNSFTVKIANNSTGSFVTTTALNESETPIDYMDSPYDISLSINSAGNRFLGGSYAFYGGPPSYALIRGGLFVLTESSPGTWVREDVLTPTASAGNFSYTSMAVKSDNTVSLLTGTRNDAYTSGNLSYSVGIPVALAGAGNVSPSFNDGATTTLTVNENSSNNSINALLDINDTDSGDTLTWSVTSGPSKGSLSGFNASGSSNGGNVTPTGLTYSPTSNQIGSDSFTVQVSDGTDTDSITVNVTINDVNPTVTANSGSIAEDAAINDAVLTMAATGDTNGLIWSLAGGTPFAINSSTGVIRVNGALDRETTPSYTLSVSVDDEDAGSTADDTESVVITLTDINDTAPDITSNGGGATASISVNEGTSAVTTVVATDADTTGTVSYEIVTGDDGDDFSIISNSGALSFASTPDFENPVDADLNNIYTVTVRATDGVNSVNQVLTVTVVNLNDAPTVDNPVADFAVDEDASDSTFNLTNIFSDLEDVDSALTYMVASNTDASVVSTSIDAGSDVLTLDYLANQNGSATITVRATDSGTLFAEDSFTVTVNAVNDTPTVSNAVADFAVDEDAADTVIDLTSLFSDVEDADSALTYTVESNSNTSLMTATVDGGSDELTLDYQANQNGTATITVRATDSGTLFVEDTFTVTVNAVNDTPAVSNAVADFAVDEDAADTVFDLTSLFSDVEDADSALTYTVESNSNASLMTATVDGGSDELTLDYQSNQSGSATITVRATDSGTLFVEDTFTVTVNAVNDTPTVDNAVADFAVDEDAADTVFDLTSLFSDVEDADSDLTYTVESNSNATLVTATVDGGSDELTLDYQANQNGTATITVRATDSGTLFVEDSFTVTVNAVNDTPTVSNAVADFAVDEDAADTVIDLTSLFSDVEDANSDLIYTVESNNDVSLVTATVDGGSDELTLDYQPNQSGSATITVRATDSGTLFVEDTFTVTVNAVNDTPTVDNAVADFAVDEDAVDTVFDLTSLFSDVEDADSDLTYTVESNSNATLVTATVDGGSDELTLDYQVNQNGTATITVRATDSGTLFVEDSFTVTVNAVNDTPTVDNAVVDFAVDEDAADTVLDLTSLFSDIEDADSDLTYTVETNSNASLVTAMVDGGSDELTLDYQANQNGTATITVRATDSGTLFVEDVFTVTVNAVNDTPTVSNAVADYAVDEDAVDTVFDLTSLFSDVEDADNDLTYTVESNSNTTLVTATVDAGSDELTLAYQANQNGTAEITVRATDSGTLFVEDTFTVTVNSVNDTPTVSNAVADFAVNEDAADTVFDLTSLFSDIEDAASDLTYTVESNSNATLVTATVDGGSDELTLDYQANQTGTAVITVRATDSGTLFVEDTFTVTVNKLIDLVVTANENVDPVLAGNSLPGNLIHQIKVMNNGPSDATNLVIDFTQTLPAGVVLNSTTISSGSEAGGTWTIPALPEGQMATLTLTLSVPATVAGGADTIVSAGGVTSVTEPLTATGDDTATVKTSVASPATTGFDLETGLIGNFSSSLIEQLVKVTNNNPNAVPAFRILVSGLPNDVTLFNSHGTTSGGRPFVVWNQELPASGTAEVLMQYYRASGVADFTPVYTIEFLTAAEATALLTPPVVGSALNVVRFVQLADGAMLLEWASVPGKKYYIQYSSDLTTYITVLPGITAGATRTQWIDRGPPQTESHPASMTGARYYRVMEAQ